MAGRNLSKPELITHFIAQLLPLIPAIICKASKLLRRSLLTVGAVLIGGTLVPSIHAASMDPVAFINALGNQLQVVARNGSPEQTLRGLRELLREDFDVPALGRFVLGRFWRIFTPSEKQEFLD